MTQTTTAISEAQGALKGLDTRKFKLYPQYRDSGVEWLQEIPVSWRVKPLKAVFKIVNGSTPRSSEPSFWDGDIAWCTPDDLGRLQTIEIRETARHITDEGYHSCGTSTVPVNSIIVSTRAPIGHVGLTAVPMCTNQGCRSLVAVGAINARYFYYQMIAAKQELQSYGQGSTYKEVSRTELGIVRIGEPPLAEQKAISDFLDRETARIDELIAKKRRLIELLREKRSALINHAVTKGQDPNAPMKPSGVDWLGNVPAHWVLHKLGYLVEMKGGSTPNKSNEEYWGGNIPWISPKDMKRPVLPDSEDHVTELAIQETNLSLIVPPVVLMVVRGMILAHTLPIAITSASVTVNQDMKALKPRRKCSIYFLAYLLGGISGVILGKVEDSAHGTKALRTELWKNIEVFLPDTVEQEQICAHIKEINLRYENRKRSGPYEKDLSRHTA